MAMDGFRIMRCMVADLDGYNTYSDVGGSRKNLRLIEKGGTGIHHGGDCEETG